MVNLNKKNRKENIKDNVRSLPCFTFINSGSCPYPNCQFIHDVRLRFTEKTSDYKGFININFKIKDIKARIAEINRNQKKKPTIEKEDIFYYPQKKIKNVEEYNINDNSTERQIWDRFICDISDTDNNEKLSKEINDRRLPVFIQCEKGGFSSHKLKAFH